MTSLALRRGRSLLRGHRSHRDYVFTYIRIPNRRATGGLCVETEALPPFEVCPRRGKFAMWIDMQVVTGVGEVMPVSGGIPPL